MASSNRAEDDLTHKLVTIIKTNEHVRKLEANGSPAVTVEEFTALVQFHVATLFDGELPGIEREMHRYASVSFPPVVLSSFCSFVILLCGLVWFCLPFVLFVRERVSFPPVVLSSFWLVRL
jgi:hypothetical protein